MGQHLCQRWPHRAVPALHQGGVCAQSLECTHAPVAVHQYQRTAVLVASGNACHQLSACLYRFSQPLHCRRIGDAGGLKAQLQAV